jgi:hypothetical protein
VPGHAHFGRAAHRRIRLRHAQAGRYTCRRFIAHSSLGCRFSAAEIGFERRGRLIVKLTKGEREPPLFFGERLAHPRMLIFTTSPSVTVLAPVVELGRAGGGMRRYLGLLQRAAVPELGGDAGAAEGVVTTLVVMPTAFAPLAHYLPGVDAVEPSPLSCASTRP